MENIINGKESNKVILRYLDARIGLMFREAQKYAEDNSLVDQVEKIDDDKFIEKERREEFDLLNELNSYLSFEKEEPANTFEFKGFEYPLGADGTNRKKTTIFVNKDNALKISKKADKFESVLGVRLPVELFLLKYKGTNMPGLDYGAPDPKTADKSRAEHEAYLEEYYDEHGVKKEPEQGLDFRKAYPHEKINCRVEPPVMGNVGQEGYYSSTVEELAMAEFEMEHGDPGLEPGEESPIKKSVPLGQRFNKFKEYLKEKDFKGKFRKALCITSLGAAAVGLFIANPPVASAILAGAGIGTLFSKKLGPKISNLFKKIKKKVRDWWLGPEVVPEQPKMTAEEVNEKIEELQMEKYVLEEEIRILTDEINLLADDNPAKQTKAQQVQEKQARLHSIELEVAALLEKFDIEHIMGGPSK